MASKGPLQPKPFCESMFLCHIAATMQASAFARVASSETKVPQQEFILQLRPCRAAETSSECLKDFNIVFSGVSCGSSSCRR